MKSQPVYEFSSKKEKKDFHYIFTYDESGIDIHKSNTDFDNLVKNGILYNAGWSTSERYELRLTNKGKQLIKK